MKRTISVLLAFFMLICALPTSAFALEADVADTAAEADAADTGATTISTVNIVATAPYAGKHPDFNVSPGNNTYSIVSVRWSSWETGSSVAMDASKDIFRAGFNYTLTLELVPSSGYQFETSGSSPGVTVKVNGSSASAYSVSGYSPSYRIQVIKTFTKIADTGLKSVQASIARPVPGEYPSYSAWIPDTNAGYEVEDYDGVSYKDGVRWYDDTAGSSINASDPVKFVSGHQYTVTVSLVPKTGYSFYKTTSSITGKINSSTATVGDFSDPDNADRNISLKYQFTCENEKINSISVTVTAPLAAEAPSFTATESASGYDVDTSLNTSYYKNGVEWYDMTAGSVVATSGTVKFIKDHKYRVSVLVKANSGYEFPESGVTGKVNGKTAGVYGMYGYDRSGYLTVEYEFTAVYGISIVKVTEVNEPIDGQSPVFSASLPTGSVFRIEPLTSGNWIKGMIWKNETDGKVMTESDKFVIGKRYSVKISLIVTNTDDYTFHPNVTGTINGNSAAVTHYSGSTPNIGLSYTFTAKYPTYIDSVNVADVFVPLPDTQPAYYATTPGGKGYVVNTSYNVGSTTKYGIHWRNESAARSMESSERFESGKRYTVRVYLSRTSNVYRFVTSGLTGTLNGHAGSVGRVDSDMVWVEYTYTCKSRTIVSNVAVSVTAPVAGQAPVFSATVPSGSGYVVKTETNNIMWKNGVEWGYDDNFYIPTDGSSGNFKAGKQYTVYVLLKPADEFCEFTDNVTGTVNGKTGTVKVAASNSAHRYIEYTFPATAEPPSQKYTLSGSITSFLDTNGNITVELLQSGSVKYSTSVKGNNVNYTLVNIASGGYTLRVSKKNHVARDYNVTISGNTTQDVKICPIGDADNNGKVNAADAKAAFQHGNEQKLITDEYKKKCADVASPKNKINSADAKAIFQHANEQKSLWTD
ncbi:MAG: hypothetical protein IJH40_10235 [Ruminococcus sp.]|uniref:hypothetical protein n=1 Tax=Ruminococcus sp. TaxID=41978 RepID=UPI002872F1E4|nr:hypothetical protein [Ruminococcus sp.]MBQ3286005.1 hypothetical protein [Ruminococcus sp.]